MSANLSIQAVGQIAIAVTDIECAVSFYRDTLGLTLLFEAPPGLAFFDCGGVRLMITTLQGEESDHRTSVIYYKVKDIHEAYAALSDKKCRIYPEPTISRKNARPRIMDGLYSRSRFKPYRHHGRVVPELTCYNSFKRQFGTNLAFYAN